MKRRVTAFEIINYAFFILLAVIMFYPFWYVLMFSVSDPSRRALDSLYLLPYNPTLLTYKNALKEPLIQSGIRNSVIVTLFGTAINLILTVTTAYPLSRPDFPAKKLIFAAIMFTMIFNGGIIPTYIVVRSYGIVNTLWALMLPSAISVYNMLIVQKFFKNIPAGLVESAHIDGCMDISILLRIVLPLSAPVIATVGLFYAVSNWNAFFPGMIYINDSKLWPMQVILVNMIRSSEVMQSLGAASDVYIAPEHIRMTTAVITALPIIMVYPFVQRFFVKGIMLGSIKE